MFDIFVYLFENYVHARACPGADQLARKLAAVGFEDDEISEALDWLHDLRQISTQPLIAAPSAASLRIYSQEEQAQLDIECRSFISFLENAEMLDPATRELIIERAMALDGFRLSLHRFKVIVLMVLWQQECLDDTLMLDELLSDEDDVFLMPLH